MKKILLVTAITSSLLASSIYAEGPARSGVVISGEGSWSSLLKTRSFNADQGIAGIKNGLGLGAGAYVGYDYAVSNNVTLGAKVGYYHVFNIAKVHSDIDAKISTDNIPLLATAKYFMDSGLYFGVEAGVDFQRLTSNTDDSDTQKFHPAVMFGGLVGYTIYDNLSVSATVDYISGINFDGTKFMGSDQTIANVKAGLQVNYLLPM